MRTKTTKTSTRVHPMSAARQPVDVTADFAEVLEIVLEKVAKLEKRASDLDEIVKGQQEAIRLLGQVIQGHQKTIEAIAGTPTAKPARKHSVH